MRSFSSDAVEVIRALGKQTCSEVVACAEMRLMVKHVLRFFVSPWPTKWNRVQPKVSASAIKSLATAHSGSFLFLSLRQQNVGARQARPLPSVAEVETSYICNMACSVRLFLTRNVASILCSGSTGASSQTKS